MPERMRTFAVLAVVAAAVVIGVVHQSGHDGVLAAGGGGRTVGQVSAAERAGTFTFAPGVGAYDRSAILTAVGHARPEARRLIGIVDGITDINVGPTPAGAVGVTEQQGRRFHVQLDLGAAARVNGQRGIDRLVLHELGHVVRFALVSPQLRDRLVAQVPRGYGCNDGVTGACTNAEEIFAESFAKWATGDIGVNLYLGYQVPPPADLEAWGTPLTQIK
jgi:hypothetical protein